MRVVGWPGAVGIILLASVAAHAVSVLRPLHRDAVALGLRVDRLQASAARPATAIISVTPQAALDAFGAALPAAHEINATFERLSALAAERQLVVKSSEFRLLDTKSATIARLQITMKAEGRYDDATDFLARAVATAPGLALARVAMTRQNLADSTLETTLEFVLFHRPSTEKRP